MSLNEKKILENILWKFYMWKISILKKFLVFRPLFRPAAISGAGNNFFKRFSSYFDRLLLQLQTLQVSEGALMQKYFLNRPWSQKNLMSSWGGRWCRCSLQHPLHVFCSLARAHAPLVQCLYFSLHTHLNPLKNISLQLKKFFPP